MDEYIKLEAAIAAIMSEPPDAHYPQWYADKIKAITAADVAPVRHERWEIVVGSDGKEHMVCTGCRKQQDLTGVFSYCPNCGAKMDLED